MNKEPYFGLDRSAVPTRFTKAMWPGMPWYKEVYVRLYKAYQALRGWY